MPCLFVFAGPDEGGLLALNPDTPLTIGRGDDATMQLVDERASRVHCALQPSTEVSGDFGMAVTRWVLSDAGSSNGTRIGPEVIRGDVTLEDGDTIQLGRTAIVYLTDSLTDVDEARARCNELKIKVSIEAAGWPLEDPSNRGTLNDE